MKCGYYVSDPRRERDYWNYAAGILALFDAMARGPVQASILPRT